MEISVVITTHNRAGLVGRAIESVLSQDHEPFEVIVVDDASSDSTPEQVRTRFPGVGYLRHAVNRGLAAARNSGLEAACHRWVFFLDDDDTLVPGALREMAARVTAFPERERYPLFNFLDSDAEMRESFLVLRPDHLFRGVLRGNGRALIQRRLFLEQGYRFAPDGFAGARGLRLQVAERYGIPCWAVPVTRVHSEAGDRIGSLGTQLGQARKYAEFHDLYLERYCDLAARFAPEVVERWRLGSAAYWLLAGERHKARARLAEPAAGASTFRSRALLLLTWLPRTVAVGVFCVYKGLERIRGRMRRPYRGMEARFGQ